MSTTDLLSRHNLNFNLYLLTASAIFASGFALHSLLSQSQKPSASGTDQFPITRSPRHTLLPHLTAPQRSALPYPPDALPSPRDINSPYGTLRAYEFGPEDGRRVLLIHGISTPCLALGGLAHALVERGCRVLLFDLPGRGYSDAPSDLEHDLRLFASVILIVLASSPLGWIGSGKDGEGFDLVGYSLGGGIAAGFTSYFGHLVRSLTLIAPSGLIRDEHISATSRVLYARTTLFEPILLRIVRRRLRKPLQEPRPGQPDVSGEHGADAKDAVQAEVNIEGNQRVVLSRSHPDITIEAAVNHQIEYHEGFVKAFMSSIRYGPIQRQHELWRRVGRDFEERGKEVLVVLGERDPIIKCEEIMEDAREVFGGRVQFRVMDAGHEAPVAKGDEVAEHIWGFWEGQ
ncbi:hypothetical protein PMZ80_004465 [Knufia obscura]|uniref:AB hydrolase-1 domain-containing protein n=2 Tax=Knufia TaxID=430999 RepID=A0AAN8EIK2_9EURO|nr:hypothetical protein PMZ80_004465 [Knufia obscura]KAK5951657.1 hypothetical protein OHC33_007336 [Knufia fluminis]